MARACSFHGGIVDPVTGSCERCAKELAEAAQSLRNEASSRFVEKAMQLAREMQLVTRNLALGEHYKDLAAEVLALGNDTGVWRTEPEPSAEEVFGARRLAELEKKQNAGPEAWDDLGETL